MPLPPTRAVTGTYTNPVTGATATGTVTFAPIPSVWTDTDGEQVLTGGGTVDLVDGAFSQALVTTDADDVEPATGRYWRIEERISGRMHRVRVFALPLGAGTPLDITAIVAADPAATQYTPVEGPEGPQGDPGPTGGNRSPGRNRRDRPARPRGTARRDHPSRTGRGTRAVRGPDGRHVHRGGERVRRRPVHPR